MEKIKSNNFINIQGWMVTKLGLKGNELIIYAIIAGFSQDGESTFHGSLSYLSEWTNTSKQTVINCLNSLQEKGLILKNEFYINNVKNCEYRATAFVEETDQSKNLTSDKAEFEYHSKNFNRVVKKFDGGGQKILPNNIEDNINNTKEKEKEKEKDDPKPPLPNSGQADFVSYEEQRKKDYELAELTKKKLQADLIKKFGV